MACPAPWLSSGAGWAVGSNAPPRACTRNVSNNFSHELKCVPRLASNGGARCWSQVFHGESRWRRCVSFDRRASSSSSWVEEDEALAEEAGLDSGLEAGLEEGSPEGSNNAGGSRDIMKEVMRRLSEEDLEETAKLYNYEEQLFSQIDFAQINAFTNKPFSGNPAAVCYLPYERDDTWLQLVAREFNLSATAFVVKRRIARPPKLEDENSPEVDDDDDYDENKESKPVVMPIENEFDIRWFSASSELDLCGHGSLASAHMLFSSGLVEGDTIIFHNKAGILEARKVAGYDDNLAKVQREEYEEDPEPRYQAKVELGKGVVELAFPLGAVSKIDGKEAQVVSDALGGVETVWVGRTPIGDYLVELPSRKHVEKVQPQFEKMVNFSGRGGVIVTARADDESSFDIVSRFFAPKQGIPEDPVCGSAHCTLGPYWSTKLKKDNLKAYQASQRGGELTVRVDLRAGHVYLQGGAVLLMAGTLLNTFRT